MFFAAAINDLFRKINRIDVNTEKLDTSHKILIEDFKELKGEFKEHVDTPPLCNRAGDVDSLRADKVAQNGKIDRLVDEVAETRGTVKIWVYIFAGLIAAIGIGSVIANMSQKENPKLEALIKLVESQNESITEGNIAEKLNNILKNGH